jgi:hypothetical protein
MSRLEVGTYAPLTTFQYFSDDYRDIIRERDKSFYQKNNTGRDNFEYVINRYTGNEYKCLNDYLRSGVVRGFTEKELKSWAYCLHSSLQFRTSNVQNGSIVYRRVKNSFPSNWRRGYVFYFAEFVSTSIYSNCNSNYFGNNVMEIKITNNGNGGNNNYCRNISDISDIPSEGEVLITAFCRFRVEEVSGNRCKLTCIGY